LLWRQAVDLALNGEHGVDPLHCLDGDRRLGEPREVEEVASRMRPARCFDDRSGSTTRIIEPVEPGISVRLHQPHVAGEMLFRMLGAAIRRIEEDGRRRIATAERPVVVYTGPEPPSAGFSFGEHWHGRVVGVDALGSEHMRADQEDERHQRCGCRTEPISERRDLKVYALAGIDLALVIERQMQAVFGEQDVRQQ
jgi:hypothetical protein